MALQAKELMVGDWVATEYDGNIKVSAILTDTVYIDILSRLKT